MASFQIMTRDCVSSAYEYTIKLTYLGISAFSIFCVVVVLGRMWWRAHRKKSATAIGRLVEHLVIVGACLDICLHLVDVLFALDCNAPPLMFLLTTYKAGIYSEATIPFNIVKEGFGLLSLSWHAHLAYCLYSWIVLKRSAGRLQRRRLPSLVFVVAAITGVRFALFHQLREGMLGLYVSSLLYDVVLLPGIIAAMLRWYFLTISVLRAGDRQQQQQQHQQQQQQQQQQQEVDADPGSMHVTVELSGARASSGVSDSKGQSSAASSTQGSTGAALPVHRPTQALAPPPRPLRQLRSLFQFPSWWSSSAGTQSGADGRHVSSSIRSGSGGESGGGLHPQHHSASLPPPHLPATSTASEMSTATTATMPPPPSSLHLQDGGGSRRERNRNSSIIRRLLRISFSVSLVWGLIAVLDIWIWTNFYAHDETAPMADVFLARMVIMRAVGAVDAIMLGDLFILCWPCARFFARLAKRLRRTVASPHGAAAAGPSSVISISKGRTSVGSEAGKSLGSMTSVRLKEDEISRITQALDRIHRARAPTRRIMSLDIFCSSWNMGGVDQETLEAGGVVNSLLPQWLPQGYSLYVLGVQECQCLREFREAVHTHLGGAEAFVMFGDELGDDQFLHGFIAITLFVQASDVASGAFRVHRGAVNKVAAGVSLGALGHAPNKGMVGLSCRYFDVSLALVTAHFASDSKGRNRVGKRNEHACTTLQGLSLHDDSDDFEVHHQHHHQICLGDFNYRLSPASPKEVLQLVARSAQQTQAAMAGNASEATPNPAVSGWRKASFHHFFQRPTGLAYSLGESPELPPCLGTRRTSMSSATTSGSWYDSAGRGLSVLGGAGGSYLSGVLPNLFAAKSASNLFQGGAEEPRGPSVAFSGISTPAATAVLPSHSSPLRMERRGTSSVASGSKSFVGDGDVEQGESSSINPDPGPPPWAPTTTISVLPSVNSTLSHDTSETGEAWEWVLRLDELSRSMRERAVFYNFVEAPITFPPSYRWNRSNAGIELAGDYTDLQQLWLAYSTFVVDHPKLFSMPRLSSFVHQSSVGNSSTVMSPRNGPPSASPSLPPGSSTSPRTPSYTDRILTHSLPGKGANLRWRLYDMMDGVALSDHRPVCAHLTLFVDADCRGFRTLPPPSKGMPSPKAEGSVRFLGSGPPATGTAVDREDLALFTIVLAHPHVTLKGRSKFLTSLSAITTHEATVLFPLVSEDPLAAERKASSLGEVMPGAGGARSAAGLLRGQSSTSSLSHHGWSSFPVQLKTVASLRFSEHLLLKLSDGRGQELGQTVVPVALGLLHKQQPGAPLVSSSSYGSLPVDEIVEGSSVNPRDDRRFRFPLTKGGALKGWITLTIKTRTKQMYPQQPPLPLASPRGPPPAGPLSK